MTDTPDASGPARESSEPVALDGTDGLADEARAGLSRRGRWTIAFLAAGLVVALGGLALFGYQVLGWWAPEDPDPAPQATWTPGPTEPPSPFAGTPAEDFAEGADGIVLPEAEPVGEFTAEEVAEALEQVRDALIAARLDHAMLVDHDPEPFLALLAFDEQPTLRAVFESGDLVGFATQVADDPPAAPVQPRVDGRISYRVATAGARNSPILEVVSRFVWVYAFETPDAEPGEDLVVVRDELVWEVRLGRPWAESSQGLWLPVTASEVWNADCDAYDEGQLGPAAEADPGDEEDAIFDPEEPLEAEQGC